MTKAQLAKQTAYKDISEECRKTKSGRNYLPLEKYICECLGIARPDFRKFNGGNHKQ